MKLQHGESLSNLAFNFNLRRYTVAAALAMEMLVHSAMINEIVHDEDANEMEAEAGEYTLPYFRTTRAHLAPLRST